MFCGAPDVYVYFECDAVCYSVSLRDEPPKKDKSKKKARRCVGRALNCFAVVSILGAHAKSQSASLGGSSGSSCVIIMFFFLLLTHCRFLFDGFCEKYLF